MQLPTICVYSIRNTITGDEYIGGTTNLKERWRAHRKQLNRGSSHHKKLLAAWDIHGESAFTLQVLEECDENNLTNREQVWISNRAPIYNHARAEAPRPYEGKSCPMPPYYTLAGIKGTKKQLAHHFGVSFKAIEERLKNGWDGTGGYTRHTVRGVTGTVAELCRHFGQITHAGAHYRIKKGWTLEAAVTEPYRR